MQAKNDTTCTKSQTYFTNENGAWQTALKQYTTGQRAFLLHMLFGVVLLASI